MVFWRSVLLVPLVCGLLSCGPTKEERADTAADTAADNARDEMQGQTYADTEGSDECTQDCSGHDAGFAYAQENEIEDPDQCDGKSESFIEGCKAYGEEIERRAEDARAAVESGKGPDKKD